MAIWREKLAWWYTIYFYIYDLNIATVNFCIVDIMEGKNAAKICDYIQKQLDKNLETQLSLPYSGSLFTGRK